MNPPTEAKISHGNSDSIGGFKSHDLHLLQLCIFDFSMSLSKLLRDCIFVPVPKGNKDLTISDNYCPIANSSTLSKGLEWCILLSYSPILIIFEPPALSEDVHLLCSGTVKNDVSCYVHEAHVVYACFLDASKAFDPVSHEILFSRLLSKNFPVQLIMVQEPAHVRQVGWLFL